MLSEGTGQEIVSRENEDLSVSEFDDSRSDQAALSSSAASGSLRFVLDVSKEKCPSPHSLGNKLARVAWAIVWGTLFRWSPRIFFKWRRFLLQIFGASIGRNARISPSVKIWAPWNLTVGDEAAIAHNVDCYCVDRLTIGNHSTVSQYAFLCTASHDVRDPHMKLITAPIVIADQAWICAGSFIGMGITIGEGAVVGAMAVVTKDVPALQIVAGNPARTIGQRVLGSLSLSQAKGV
jgi:putative colanic acid biosynthesis acetyltransferase WcaF